MQAKITVEKSFDVGKEFSKDWEPGDFMEFLAEEGKYLDRLGGTVELHGKPGEGFTVTYTVTLTK